MNIVMDQGDFPFFGRSDRDDDDERVAGSRPNLEFLLPAVEIESEKSQRAPNGVTGNR